MKSKGGEVVGEGENEQGKEKDYKAIIRARANKMGGLRQTLKEGKEETEQKSLRQKIELAKEKKKEE